MILYDCRCPLMFAIFLVLHCIATFKSPGFGPFFAEAIFHLEVFHFFGSFFRHKLWTRTAAAISPPLAILNEQF